MKSMTSDTNILEEKIKELEGKIEALSDRCHDLEWRMTMLAVSKISDPRYPYWNWILGRAVIEETRRKLNFLLSALNDRFSGMGVPEEERKDIDDIPRELLYGSGLPQIEEVFAAIKRITKMASDWQVVDMIRAVNDQGMFQELCEHVLSSLFVATLPGRNIR